MKIPFLSCLKNSRNVASYCSAIQSIVVSVAVIIGGIWTYHEFTTTRKAETAQEEQASKLDSQVALDVRVNAKQLDLPDVKKLRIVLVTVSLKNSGRQSVTLDLKEPPVYVIRLLCQPGSEPIAVEAEPIFCYRYFKNESIIESEPIDSKVIPPNSEKSMSFLAQVKSPGLYVIQFRAPLGNKSQGAVQKSVEREMQGKTVSNLILWADCTYLHIK